MQDFLTSIWNQFQAIDWNGPVWIVLVIFVILLLMRRWSILLLTMLIIVLAWGAQDMMITNLDTNRPIVSVPLLIYAVGGVIVVILAIISFFKSD